MVEKQTIYWSDIERNVKILAKKIIRSKIKFKNIYGIPRGGLIPAVMLSHKLKLPIIGVEKIGKNTLVVDDIVDTSKMLKYIKSVGLEKFKGNLYIVSVFVRYNTPIFPDFYGKVVYYDSWLVFPWENLDGKII